VLKLPVTDPAEEKEEVVVPKKKEPDFWRLETLCKTVEGRVCPLLVVSEGA